MATTEIEVRVLALEKEITTLKDKLEKIEKTPAAWWNKIAGTFADDADYEEAMRLGRQFRLAHKENGK